MGESSTPRKALSDAQTPPIPRLPGPQEGRARIHARTRLTSRRKELFSQGLGRARGGSGSRSQAEAGLRADGEKVMGKSYGQPSRSWLWPALAASTRPFVGLHNRGRSAVFELWLVAAHGVDGWCGRAQVPVKRRPQGTISPRDEGAAFVRAIIASLRASDQWPRRCGRRSFAALRA